MTICSKVLKLVIINRKEIEPINKIKNIKRNVNRENNHAKNREPKKREVIIVEKDKKYCYIWDLVKR